MTKNRRYEAHYDALNDRRMAAAPVAPCSLPMQAYGPDRPAEKLPCSAAGWNDRVVFVQWYSDRGQLQATVWRNAVTHRRPGSGQNTSGPHTQR